MAGKWAITNVIIYQEERGKSIKKFPGDWVELGGQELRRRLARGDVYIPDARKEAEALELTRCAIVIVGGKDREVAALGRDLKGITITGIQPGSLGRIRFNHEYAFIWTPGTPINASAILAGFVRLMDDEQDGVQWDLLATLADDELTLAEEGSDEDKAKTEEVIGTLRLPVYVPGALWVRVEAENARRMLTAMHLDINAGANPAHAFARALFPFPLAICTLGANWISRHAKLRR